MADRLKDRFFTPASVEAMAAAIGRFFPAFDAKRFVTLVFDGSFEKKELMARMRHATECLRATLPASYIRCVKILEKAAPFVGGFDALCLPDFVELYGLDDWDVSLRALAVFTRYSSSEFAIRPFILRDPRRAMAYLEKLADDADAKVRRFASEGCRPRLPWAAAIPAFKKDPGPVLRVLEKLKDDEDESVRRSVANNLNDISKDHPELVLDRCRAWSGRSERTDRIMKHACRTLLKAGDPRAMLLFGFGDPKRIAVENLSLDRKKLLIGGAVRFSFTLKVGTQRPCKIRLEYAVQFARAGGANSRKVFKITENTYRQGSQTVARKHSFADLSTRRHHPGEHEIAIIVNGVEKARTKLTLVAARDG